MQNETIKFKGHLDIVLKDENGNLKDQRNIDNTMTLAGKYGIADQLTATPNLTPNNGAKPGWMAIGTGTPGATLLGTELDRNALTSKTDTNGVVTMVGDWAAGDGTGTITEAGIFDVVTANTANMWSSASFSAITKGASDTLSISWTWSL